MPFGANLLHLTLLLLLPLAGCLKINSTGVLDHLTTLALHNDLTPPSVQRILYTPSDITARSYLRSILEDAGLEVTEDPIGNIFATWHGLENGILTGSHFDAIPNSGMYDGTLGILSALEAVKSLNQSGFVPRKSITIIAFTSEEPTRFGLSCIGSRLLSNSLPLSSLLNLTDRDGITFETARENAGYGGELGTVPLSLGDYTAFIELHSEQAPLLEDSGIQIGAVSAIAAPAALEVTFTGPGGHAGTTLMHTRHDPSLAAAELSLIVEAAVEKHGGADTVGTSGFIEITPNAINSVPTSARIGIDVRDIDKERRDIVLGVIETTAGVIADKRGVGVEVVVKSRDPPATCDRDIVESVVDVAKQNGMSVMKMISRAYHDSLFMARILPTSMIFVPCRGGISHRPDEFVELRDIENGVRVLAGVLKKMAGDRRDEDASKDGDVEEAEKVVEGDSRPSMGARLGESTKAGLEDVTETPPREDTDSELEPTVDPDATEVRAEEEAVREEGSRNEQITGDTEKGMQNVGNRSVDDHFEGNFSDEAENGESTGQTDTEFDEEVVEASVEAVMESQTSTDAEEMELLPSEPDIAKDEI